MNLKHFAAILNARTMEFIRDRETFFWNLLFPLLLVFGFAFAFSGSGESVFKVGYVGSIPDHAPLAKVEQIEYLPQGDGLADLTQATERLRQHKLDLLIDWQNRKYWYNEQSKKSLAAKRWLLAEASLTANSQVTQGGTVAAGFEGNVASGDPIRYVDWLVPGVIGMNMMFSCLFGVGYVLVRYRKNGVLKRLKATPVNSLTFVSAQATSRLIIVMVTSVVVYTGTNIFLGFVMKGNYLTLFLLTTLAVLSMISLGLLFATRLKSEELASGLLNLLTFPMMLLSGVFFSLDGSPEILQMVANTLPLTHFISAARAIMLDGAGFLQILPNIAYLGITSLVFLVLSAFFFKWE